MARLDRYILAQLLWVFGFFSLVLVAVTWVNRAVRLFDQLIGDGQPMLVFLEFTLLSLPILIRTVLPIAAFVAAIYVTLALLRSNELTVVQAAGLSPWRLARPVALFGLIVAGFLAVLMHLLIPAARAQLAERQAEIAQNITSGLLQAGVFQHPGEGLTVFISEITQEGGLRGVFLSDHRAAGQRIDYTARSALIVPERSGPKLVMIDGFAQIYDRNTGQLFTTTFGDFTYDLGAFIGPAGRGRSVQELGTRDLFAPSAALLEETRASMAQLRYELASRIVDPLMAMATALLGFAVLMAGGFNRLGFWRPVLLAVVLLGLTQVLANALTGQALRAPERAWLAVVPLLTALAIIAAFLARAAGRRGPRPRPAIAGTAMPGAAGNDR
ncbi:MAG: LPS export ABC transporter permease LptF [Pararhodobacter sp.]|nr:LPS export ABC transporter permease LptF [Pararhodobacter sp.]